MRQPAGVRINFARVRKITSGASALGCESPKIASVNVV